MLMCVTSSGSAAAICPLSKAHFESGPLSARCPQWQLQRRNLRLRDGLMRCRGGQMFAAEKLSEGLSPSRVTLLGALVNIMLSALKFIVGTASGSVSLVADAYHSGSDLAVDAVTMVAVNAPPAWERAATLSIAALLASAGATMAWQSCLSMWRRQLPSPESAMGIPPLVVAAFCILTKELLFRITRAVGQRTRQPVLFAAAKHHRSDAMSSLAAAVGAGGVLVGLPIADTIAAGVVGCMMFSMGVQVARGNHDGEHGGGEHVQEPDVKAPKVPMALARP